MERIESQVQRVTYTLTPEEFRRAICAYVKSDASAAAIDHRTEIAIVTSLGVVTSPVTAVRVSTIHS